MTTTARASVRGAHGAHDLHVASVPFSHVYVRHLAPEHGGGRVHRIPDSDPDEPIRPNGEKWWPSVMLHPAWVAQHTFDVFHLQFGYEGRRPEDLLDVVRAVQDRGRPFVYTVHDLRNPHHRRRVPRDSQLDALIPAADAVLTLTPGAAAEIERRWNRQAIVVPHPHVVPLRTIERIQRRPHHLQGGGFRVGVHVASQQPGTTPLQLLPALVRAVHELPGGVLQVNGHRDLLEFGGARYDPELAGYLREAARAGRLELRVHDHLSDAQVWRYLDSLDAAVLPGRFGTHSGLLEACRDVGTTVVAPDCGYFAEQGPVLSYRHEDEVDEESLAAALRTAWQHRRLGEVTALQRRHQRADLAARHELLYRALLV